MKTMLLKCFHIHLRQRYLEQLQRTLRERESEQKKPQNLTLFKEVPTALRGPFKITDSDFLPAILEVALAVPALPTPTLLLLVVFADEEEINAIEDTDDDKDVISVPELTGKVALGNGDGVPLGGP